MSDGDAEAPDFHGVANLSRRRAESVVQIVAFGTGIMVLLLLSIIRNDLNSDWRSKLPTNLPNYFFINIPPADRKWRSGRGSAPDHEGADYPAPGTRRRIRHRRSAVGSAHHHPDAGRRLLPGLAREGRWTRFP